MGNLNNDAVIYTCRIDKGNVNENSLRSLFERDSDFSTNEDCYQDDTLELGFDDEAHRQSTEIFEKHKGVEDESERVLAMIEDVFEVEGFIGTSSYYGDYTYEIIETDFEYIVAIATIM